MLDIMRVVIAEPRVGYVSSSAGINAGDSGTLTPMLKKMEDKGYVSRVRSSVDERRVNVRLTEAGEKLKEEAREVPMAMGQCVNIDPDDAAKLVHLLRKILANVRES